MHFLIILGHNPMLFIAFNSNYLLSGILS